MMVYTYALGVKKPKGMIVVSSTEEFCEDCLEDFFGTTLGKEVELLETKKTSL